MAAKAVSKKSPGSESDDTSPKTTTQSPFNAACPAPSVGGGNTLAKVAAGKDGAKKKDAAQMKAAKAKAKADSLAIMAPLSATESKNKQEISALQQARKKVKKEERVAARFFGAYVLVDSSEQCTILEEILTGLEVRQCQFTLQCTRFLYAAFARALAKASANTGWEAPGYSYAQRQGSAFLELAELEEALDDFIASEYK